MRSEYTNESSLNAYDNFNNNSGVDLLITNSKSFTLIRIIFYVTINP